jgi:uncharacterized surface protein with fasciclin (FAS1) repeats
VSRAGRRTLTTIAAMALALAACDVAVEPDEPTDEPTEEPTETPDEPTETDEPDDQAQVAALPTGMFGPECERLMEGVATVGGVDDDPLGQGQDQDTLGDGAGGAAGQDDQDDLTDDTTEDSLDDNAATGEGDPLADDDAATAPEQDDATARLATMSLTEALDAIEDLQPLARFVQLTPLAELIEDEGPLTVFAPMDLDTASDPLVDGQTDETDNGLTEDATEDGTGNGLDGTTAGTDDLNRLVEAHVHAGQALDATQLVESSPIETLGATVELTVTVDEDNGLADNDVTGGGTENGLTDNGTDNALTDDGLTDDGTDNGLTDDDALTEDGDLTETPTDADAPTLRVEGPDGDEATVLCANIETADGFIHVIDQPVITAGFEGGNGRETHGTDDPLGDADDNGLPEDDDADELTS